MDAVLAKLVSFETNVDARLDSISGKIERLENTVTSVQTAVAAVRVTADANSDRIYGVTEVMEAHETRIKNLEESANKREQQLRSNAIRLLNFPVKPNERDDDYQGLATAVYEQILKPILNAAKQAKDLSAVPAMKNTIEAIFRPYSTSTSASTASRAPPVIIKLVNRSIKLAILKNKRESTPAPSAEDQRSGITRYILVEDITAMTHRKMRELATDPRVDKTWTIEGNIRYTLKDKQGVHKVKFVGDTVEEILS